MDYSQPTSSSYYPKNNRISIFLLVSVTFTLLLPTFGVSLYSAAGLGIFLFIVLIFLQSLGESIPVPQLIILLAALQWIIGPVLSYAGFSHHYKYFMYIPAEEYLPFAMAGLGVLWLGMSLFNNRKELSFHETYQELINSSFQENPWNGYRLILIGILSSLLQRFVPASLQFVFFLLSNLVYIGALYLFFQSVRYKWLVLGSLLFLLFLGSLGNTMFHNLILWLIFIGFYVLLYRSFSFSFKLSALLIGIAFVFTLQVVKWELRRGNYALGKLSSYFAIVEDKIINAAPYETLEPSDAETPFADFVNRINQGWIISRIMWYIPSEKPYMNGETVEKAVEATLLPRFLNPDKAVAGGHDYFPRMTGYELNTASMGASLLGEGYANYGKMGALIFLFCFGIMIRFVLNKIYDVAERYPTLLLWIPLIFFQVVKAESDLLRVLNHLTKSLILVAILYWGFRKFLKWEL